MPRANWNFIGQKAIFWNNVDWVYLSVDGVIYFYRNYSITYINGGGGQSGRVNKVGPIGRINPSQRRIANLSITMSSPKMEGWSFRWPSTPVECAKPSCSNTTQQSFSGGSPVKIVFWFQPRGAIQRECKGCKIEILVSLFRKWNISDSEQCDDSKLFYQYIQLSFIVLKNINWIIKKKTIHNIKFSH